MYTMLITGFGLWGGVTYNPTALVAQELDGKTLNPAPFYKDMLGWNRRALRITVGITATPDQLSAVETLCAMAARKWTAA